MTTSRAILLVEDNEDDVLLMKLALKEAGIKNPLSIVEDGEQAINFLSQCGTAVKPYPAVVFLDLKLPIKSGFEVLSWIKKQTRLADVAVIVLTSSNQQVDLQQAYRLGANSFIVKPPTADQLSEMAKAFRWYWLEYNQFEQHVG